MTAFKVMIGAKKLSDVVSLKTYGKDKLGTAMGIMLILLSLVMIRFSISSIKTNVNDYVNTKNTDLVYNEIATISDGFTEDVLEETSETNLSLGMPMNLPLLS